MKWTVKTAFIAGSALILVVNGIVLAGAAYNRSAEESRMRLSERELRPAAVHDELDSALSLRLRWRVLDDESKNSAPFEYGDYRGAPAWLNERKMASLGFDTSVPDGPYDARRSFSRSQSREAFVVLEFDGPAYQESLQRAKAQAERLRGGAVAGDARRPAGDPLEMAARIIRLETQENSRVFVVDAGLDDRELRARYPDRANHAIVRALIEPNRYPGAGSHRGIISKLSIPEIHVPVEMRRAFDGAEPAGMPWKFEAGVPAGRYEAEIAFGRRLEPWLAAAARK